MVTESFIEDVMGCRVRHLSKGSGQPIIMISGWLGSADNFIPLMEILSDKFRCIAIDLPGLGKTTPFKNQKHTVHNFTNFIEALLKSLDISGPIILGVSLGASISLDYAERAQNKPSKIILQSPVYRPIQIERRAKLALWMLDTFRPLSKLLLKLCSNNIFQKIIMLSGDSNIKSISFEMLSKYGTPGLSHYDTKAMIETVKDVINLDITEGLAQAKNPTLLLCGTKENLFPPNYQGDLASRLPNCQYCVINDGTHYLFLQKPNKMVELIMKFLER